MSLEIIFLLIVDNGENNCKFNSFVLFVREHKRRVCLNVLVPGRTPTKTPWRGSTWSRRNTETTSASATSDLPHPPSWKGSFWWQSHARRSLSSPSSQTKCPACLECSSVRGETARLLTGSEKHRNKLRDQRETHQLSNPIQVIQEVFDRLALKDTRRTRRRSSVTW